MTTNQSAIQEAVRARSGSALDYNSDWMALFDTDGIASGSFNERMLNWLNGELATALDPNAPYSALQAAQQAYAVQQGFDSWHSMNTLI